MRAIFAAALALALAAGAPAQRGGRTTPGTAEDFAQQGAALDRDAAEELERQLTRNPHDLAARAKLLGYYFYQWMAVGEEAAKAARARHILWLIEHHPEAPVTAIYEAAIDPRGHQLADPAAYEKAQQLWAPQAESNNPRVLANMARFYQLNDRELAEKLLLKAMELEPQNGEWEWRLGFLYGLGILGVDGLAFNGQPTSIDPLAKNGPFAAHAKRQLETLRSPMVLAVAGNTLYRYGSILAPTPQARVEFIADAERLFRRAQSLEPNNPTWAQLVQQLQNMKTQMTAPGR